MTLNFCNAQVDIFANIGILCYHKTDKKVYDAPKIRTGALPKHNISQYSNSKGKIIAITFKSEKE